MHTALLTAASVLAAFSSSPNLQLNNYSLGSSGSSGSHSTNYYLEGSSGELQDGSTLSATYQLKSGEIQAQQPNVPGAPTVSNNGGAYYNKLQLILSTSGNASDTTYSVAISTNNFVTTNYVQADGTIGATAVYRTYSAWGGSSGTMITGLNPNTTFKVKTDAMQGMYANSAYGPATTATTGTPTLSFALGSNSTSLPALSSGSASFSPVNLSYSTNGSTGGFIYVVGSTGGLKSPLANYTIPSTSMDLTTGQGFGLRSISTSQTSGGPLTAQSPYNNASTNVVGAVLTSLQPLYASSGSVTNASATFNIGASRNATTPAASDYQETMTFIATASF